MTLVVLAEARKALAALQPALRRRIMASIERIYTNPRAPNNNLKPLKGLRRGYRIRVGDWRVSFTLGTGTMTVFEIAPRGGAYR